MVVLVTGRILADLQRLLNDPWIFDVIVAESCIESCLMTINNYFSTLGYP